MTQFIRAHPTDGELPGPRVDRIPHIRQLVLAPAVEHANAALGCDVVDIRERVVHENTVYWDGAGFARQIGMLPRQGSAADRAMLASFNALTWLRTLGGRRLPKRA